MMNSIRHRTLVTQDKCFLLDRCLRHSLRVTTGATAVAECGVFKGGTAFLLASILKSENPELTLHLFDTFKGIPESSDCDMTAVGDLANTSLESVQDFLRPFPVVVFHPGFIPNTFAGLREQRYCFVHVDVDNYRSTLSCCEYFYPRLLPGGMLICDDYLLPGAKKAVNDFFATKPEVPIPMRSGQCLIVRGNQP
jgi:O-methyltransferase